MDRAIPMETQEAVMLRGGILCHSREIVTDVTLRSAGAAFVPLADPPSAEARVLRRVTLDHSTGKTGKAALTAMEKWFFNHSSDVPRAKRADSAIVSGVSTERRLALRH